MGIEPTSSAWKAEVLPLNYTRTFYLNNIGLFWRGEDSNLRRRSRQIYSLIPLATREPLQQCRAHNTDTFFFVNKKIKVFLLSVVKLDRSSKKPSIS